VSRLEVGKKLGGDTAGTNDSKWPKGYAVLYDVMLSNKSWGNEKGEGVWSYGVCLPK